MKMFESLLAEFEKSLKGDIVKSNLQKDLPKPIKEYTGSFVGLYSRAINLAVRKIETGLEEYERMYDVSEEALLNDEEFQRDVVDLTLEEINKSFSSNDWFNYDDFKEEVIAKVKQDLGIIVEDLAQMPNNALTSWVVNNIVKEIKTYHNPSNSLVGLLKSDKFKNDVFYPWIEEALKKPHRSNPAFCNEVMGEVQKKLGLTEGYGRPSNIYGNFFKDIIHLPAVAKVVKDHATSNGHAFLVRTKDGNAYEITVTPAAYAKYFADARKEEQYKKRKEEEKQKGTFFGKNDK